MHLIQTVDTLEFNLLNIAISDLDDNQLLKMGKDYLYSMMYYEAAVQCFNEALVRLYFVGFSLFVANNM